MATPFIRSRVNGIVIPVPAHQAGMLHRFDTAENRPLVDRVSMGNARGEMQSMVIDGRTNGVPVLGAEDSVPNAPTANLGPGVAMVDRAPIPTGDDAAAAAEQEFAAQAAAAEAQAAANLKAEEAAAAQLAAAQAAAAAQSVAAKKKAAPAKAAAIPGLPG